MKVLILSTYEKAGGAAIAASRLLQALRHNGVEATMLCRKNIHVPAFIHKICPAYAKQLEKQSWTSILERVVIWVLNGFSKKDLWATDIALFGQDITKTKEYQDADVIHLHWVNQGFLSLSQIRQFIKDGKKVVWTMHDEWPLSYITHYGDEPLTLLARIIRYQKKKLLRLQNITFVTCSKWLKSVSESKPLAKEQTIKSIPNCIDSTMFKPLDKMECRKKFGLPIDKKIVLFVAQNVNDERKGIKYLNEATALLDESVMMVAPGREIPYINNVNDMVMLYVAADVFVTPSLQDNLPNTIMEAMACGTPCVGFDVGGIPEMIDHKENGYLARFKSSQELAEGIRYVLNPENHERLSKAAREKVMQQYSEKSVAQKYVAVYEQI